MAKTNTSQELSPAGLPIKEIPGSYGIPFFSAIHDRLNFYYFQGPLAFFRSQVVKHNATVVRLNTAPGPFIAKDPRVVALLDSTSYRVLFDPSKVDKTDTFVGTYVPSWSLTAGIRPVSYRDATDPEHTSLRTLILYIQTSRKMHFIPCFHEVYSSLFDKIEVTLNKSGPVVFNDMNNAAVFDFMCGAFFGGELPSVSIGPSATNKATTWLFFQFHPLFAKVSNFLPWLLEDLLIHTFPFPNFLVRSDYKALETYFSKVAGSILDKAEELGISRDVALPNLIFITLANAFPGIKGMFMVILKWLTLCGPTLHDKLVQEIRSVVKSGKGPVSPSVLDKMPLVKSFVSECLRLNPPAEYQYGRARTDLIIESHDAAYKVKKGELLAGYQTIATRDEKVFPNADECIPDRFVGEEGQKLLKYVYWSNNAETAEPTASDKQCPGKNTGLLLGRAFVAEFFLRYDTFTADIGEVPLEPKITFKSFTRASGN
ncbi:hypothetical protein LUZ60_012341 [Juncus effusus]|nr:hypothetical protein LUZ60_012341 [Juncus effusus]